MNVNKKEVTLLDNSLSKMKISDNGGKKEHEFGLSVSILIALAQDVHNIILDIKKINNTLNQHAEVINDTVIQLRNKGLIK